VRRRRPSVHHISSGRRAAAWWATGGRTTAEARTWHRRDLQLAHLHAHRAVGSSPLLQPAALLLLLRGQLHLVLAECQGGSRPDTQQALQPGSVARGWRLSHGRSAVLFAAPLGRSPGAHAQPLVARAPGALTCSTDCLLTSRLVLRVAPTALRCPTLPACSLASVACRATRRPHGHAAAPPPHLPAPAAAITPPPQGNAAPPICCSPPVRAPPARPWRRWRGPSPCAAGPPARHQARGGGGSEGGR